MNAARLKMWSLCVLLVFGRLAMQTPESLESVVEDVGWLVAPKSVCDEGEESVGFGAEGVVGDDPGLGGGWTAEVEVD